MTGVLESEVTSRNVPARWLAAVVGFFGLFFAIAWVSQWWILRRWYLEEAIEQPAPSVGPHALTMTVVAVLALAIAVPLLREGMFVAAGLTCLGAAIGPLRLVAAPVFASVGATTEVIPDFVWRLGVGVALLVVLLLVARWVAGPALREPPRWGPVVLVLIAVPVLVLLLWPGARTQEATDDTIWIDMAVGWGLLIGGLLAAGLVGSIASAIARGLLAAAMATMLWLVYDVGEQAVPGWESGGDEPMFLTAQVSITLGVFAVAGFLLAVSGVGHRGSQDP
ncbi:MAG TPA: hypothetical protein PKH30_00355 [Actinomycetota bacterium]|nr:hypothetical protein [Actinomycetota bacterium]HNO14580.1 hypothetical protein [Actinomycetota bacterium]